MFKYYQSKLVMIYRSDRDPTKPFAVQHRAHVWRFKTLDQAVTCAQKFDINAHA